MIWNWRGFSGAVARISTEVWAQIGPLDSPSEATTMTTTPLTLM
jgi:hypothetical protein